MHFSFANETNEMRLMAAFVAQLVREGVTFKVTNINGYFDIELTGGF
jgi:hypothetical protein